MSTIINVENSHHLGDNIINFIFFYKIKDYIESNNIVINYYCWKQYHKNLSEFNCSKNINIVDCENPMGKGYVLWQGGSTPNISPVEDKLCNMFNIFLRHHNIPIIISEFEYQDDDLFNRYNNLEEKYQNVDILVINSKALSGQYHLNKNEWDSFISNIRSEFKIATTEKVNDNIVDLSKMTVKTIAAIALKAKYIIAINTGPSIPLYNTDILNQVSQIYLFGAGDGSQGHSFKTRKIKVTHNLSELSFLH